MAHADSTAGRRFAHELLNRELSADEAVAKLIENGGIDESVGADTDPTTTIIYEDDKTYVFVDDGVDSAGKKKYKLMETTVVGMLANIVDHIEDNN